MERKREKASEQGQLYNESRTVSELSKRQPGLKTGRDSKFAAVVAFPCFIVLAYQSRRQETWAVRSGVD